MSCRCYCDEKSVFTLLSIFINVCEQGVITTTMKECRQHNSGIGGQAVLEGVMMRNKDRYAIAVRKSDGSIVIKNEIYKGIFADSPLKKIPFVRGIFVFIDSMILGLRCTDYSATIYAEDDPEAEAEKKAEGRKTPLQEEKEAEGRETRPREDKEEEGRETRPLEENVSKDKGTPPEEEKESLGERILMTLVMIVSLILALGLFMALPVFLASHVVKFIGNDALLSLFEGLIRIAIFVIYILLISQMKDIRRLFQYHGAEHKCINCLEGGKELTVENAAEATRLHKRCGSSFILFVMLVSIVLFFFIKVRNPLARVGIRILLLPLISGISYELIRFAGSSDNPVIGLLSKPGLWLQGLTTREPDEEMLQVAIQSVEAVFDWRAYLASDFGMTFDERPETGTEQRKTAGAEANAEPARAFADN